MQRWSVAGCRRSSPVGVASLRSIITSGVGGPKTPFPENDRYFTEDSQGVRYKEYDEYAKKNKRKMPMDPFKHWGGRHGTAVYQNAHVRFNTALIPIGLLYWFYTWIEVRDPFSVGECWSHGLVDAKKYERKYTHNLEKQLQR